MSRPSYSSISGNGNLERNGLIREYFFAGYTYSEMLIILFYQHSISMSLRQLNRVLRKYGLYRRNNVPVAEVQTAIQHELQNSGSCLGYRSMTRRLLTGHGIAVSRSLVSDVLRNVDPEGVSKRRRHQFSRRVYINKGQNYLIHVDGYDKLKRYGFPIHGAICGFSRRILWLNVANTNNNPRVIGTFFLDYLNEIKGVPRCVRMDGGTENVLLEDIQKAFRWEHQDEMAAENSAIKASSHSNQRIERWWRSNKQGGCQFWIDLFSDLEGSGLLCTCNAMHIECMRFCFMDLLQDQLDTIRMEWNQHSVRRYRQETPSGKPDMMFYIPSLWGTIDYSIAVDQEDLNVVIGEYRVPIPRGCMEENATQFHAFMNEKGLRMPSSTNEAVDLFGQLTENIIPS